MKLNYMFRSMAAVFLFVVLMSCSRSMPAARTGSVNRGEPASLTSITKDILTYINDYRRSKGLTELQDFAPADEQAYNHSVNMASGKTAFSHNGFDARVAAITKTNGRMSAWAENVAMGQMSAREVVKGWLNSPGHKKNIEGNYTLTGIGVARAKNGDLYFTQMFLRK